MWGFLLSGLTSTTAAALPPQAAHRPHLSVVARLSPEAERSFREVLRELSAREPGAFSYSVAARGPYGSVRLPHPRDWDLAIGFPSFVLEAAAGDGVLLALGGGRTFRVAKVVPYGAVTGTGEAPTWDEVLGVDGEQLILPDVEAEPEFKEAMAALLGRFDRAAVRSILTRARGARRSGNIRRELQRLAGTVGILALTREESARVDPLPAARLGIAVSARTKHPDVARSALEALLAPEDRERWLAFPPGFLPGDAVNVQLLGPPGPDAITTIERIAARAFGGPPDGERTLTDWIETALLACVAAIVAVAVWSGRRRRTVAGPRPPTETP